MPTSFSHIDLCLVTLPLLLLQLLQNCYCYFCHYYCYFHTTLLSNTLLQILSNPGVVELTTQLLVRENILWLPMCRINKFGLNTLPSKTVVIVYTCGLSETPSLNVPSPIPKGTPAPHPGSKGAGPSEIGATHPRATSSIYSGAPWGILSMTNSLCKDRQEKSPTTAHWIIHEETKLLKDEDADGTNSRVDKRP